MFARDSGPAAGEVHGDEEMEKAREVGLRDASTRAALSSRQPRSRDRVGEERTWIHECKHAFPRFARGTDPWCHCVLNQGSAPTPTFQCKRMSKDPWRAEDPSDSAMDPDGVDTSFCTDQVAKMTSIAR